jgi:hypothetical protein
VSMKMSLELVARDGVDVCMGVAVRLPSVGYRSIELVCGKKGLSHDLCIGRSRASSRLP